MSGFDDFESGFAHGFAAAMNMIKRDVDGGLDRLDNNHAEKMVVTALEAIGLESLADGAVATPETYSDITSDEAQEAWAALHPAAPGV